MTSDHVPLSHSDFSEWLQLTCRLVSLILGSKKAFLLSTPSWPSSPTKLTSQLARPPLPHLCSLRVCKKSKEHLSCEAPPTSPSASCPWKGGVWPAPAYQVFEFCREAAVVGLFHVHHFRVCAQNVKFPGSESQEKNHPRRWLSGQRTKWD